MILRTLKAAGWKKLQTLYKKAFDEAKIMTTRGALPYLERGRKYAQLRFDLILFKKQRQIAMYQTLISLKSVVKDLDNQLYDFFLDESISR